MLDERVPGWLQEHAVPSVAITFIHEGEIDFTAVYGEQAPGVPATEQTLYSTASIGKPITAEVVLRLVSDGRISLGESMSTHWVDPDIAGDARHMQLTPRLVLIHQTGFPNWRRQTGGVLRFERDPGTETGYSGEGFEYLVRFVERKLKTPFEQLAEDYLFSPAGMENTAYTERPWFTSRLAWPQFPDGEYRRPFVPPTASGAGDIRMTSEDYARFLISVMSGEGLTGELAGERVRLQSDLLSDVCPPLRIEQAICPRQAGFGLSWFVHEYDEETVISHTGSNLGEKTLAFFVPERRLGVAIFSNGANGNEVIYKVADILYDNKDWLEIITPAPE